MSNDIPIIKTDYGIASNYGDFIEINRKLDRYPHLKEKIIAHENRHTSGKYTINDFKNDFQSEQSTFFETVRFCLKNKEGIINYLPFMYSYHLKEWTYNSSSFPPLIVMGIIFIIFWHFTVGLPYLHLIVGWLAAVLTLNAIFAFVTHTYVKTTQFTRENKHK